MPHFVVLLRGVNVGAGNRVPMAEFRAALEALGARDVRTLLNSGNAVFASTSRSAERLAARIAEVVADRFGVRTPVIVKSKPELDAILQGNPFPPPTSDHARFLVAFAMDPSTLDALRAVEPLLHPRERFAVTPHAAYLHCTGGLLESTAGAALLGRVGRQVTTRNWATVLKLAALLDRSRTSPAGSTDPSG